jgi:hypothetical protein
MRKLIASAALLLGMAGPANAMIIEYDFTGGSGKAPSYEFTVDGLTATATASSSGFKRSANVTRDKHGLGVKSNRDDDRNIDGKGRNDYLTVTFDFAVDLLGLKFGHKSKNDEFDLYLDGTKTNNNRETTSGWKKFAMGAHSGTSFTVRASQKNDNFVLKGMRVAATPIPAPGSLALLGLGLAGLGAIRHFRKA